jgi:diguanylate cyclase (GGDEF)-like protein
MTTGIRGRILTWLVIAIVPVLIVALASSSMVESRLAERVEIHLASVLQLESNRIGQDLAGYTDDAERLARIAFVEILTGDVPPGWLGPYVASGGESAFDTDPDASTAADPDANAANPVADAISDAALGADSSIVEARVIALDGSIVDESPGYRWEAPPDLTAAVIAGEPARFGPAYAAGEDDFRVGLVTPIEDPERRVVAVLLSEIDISHVVNLMRTHESFGDSTEAILAQRVPNGDVQFITPLRFQRKAAFMTATPTQAGSAISRSLDSTTGVVVQGIDYRGVETIAAIEQIGATGWGLTVKMDAADAFGLARSIRTLVLLGSLLAIVAILIGWALVLRPLVRRIRGTARAAEGVAKGDYTSKIHDRTRDEIGEVARAIDRLAADLEFDIRMRTDAERRLRHQASHDELTDIYNRQHMTSIIRDLLRSGSDQSVSLLFLDLDDFKLVNDLWGHAVGDEVLTAVANRLRRLVGDDVSISRWGGDEFTVVLRNADRATLNSLAHRVRELFTEPVNTSVGPHPIACSVGVATAFSGDDLDQLLHDADAKMFEEKQANRKSRMIEPETARLIEMALADGRLEVHYQPIVSLQSPTETRLEAVEALVRIRGNDGMLRHPSEFLPEVLSHRYALEIDRSMAMMALSDLAEWREAGLVSREFLMTLNLSPASMRDPSLAQALLAVAATCHIEPSSIVLELSEQAEDLDSDVLGQLRRSGFKIAVDDLGVERSNLDRLIGGSTDIAKIGRRWLEDPVVLEALVTTCHHHGVEVIGKGIETMHELGVLFAHDVRLCQGFVIAAPRTSSDMRSLLVNGDQRADQAASIN